MESNGQVVLKAMCIFEKDGKILVTQCTDKFTNETFYRLLGGSINYLENSEDGVRREVREEIHTEIDNLKYVATLENIFTYGGKKWHEIDFLYIGDLVDESLYEKSPIRIIEKTYELEATWIPIDEVLNSGIKLYPEYNYRELFNLK